MTMYINFFSDYKRNVTFIPMVTSDRPVNILSKYEKDF